MTRLLGLNPDSHGVLTINAWLTNVFSVGFLSALAAVIFFRLALLLFQCRVRTAWAASVAFALGTLWFPYATLFQESNLTAAGLLAAFYFVTLAGNEKPFSPKILIAAGLCSGMAVLTNYLAVVPVALMGLLALYRLGFRSTLLYALGGLAPFILLCFYNYVCFGTVVTTNYRYENPIFLSPCNVMGHLRRAQFFPFGHVAVLTPFAGYSSPRRFYWPVCWDGYGRSKMKTGGCQAYSL